MRKLISKEHGDDAAKHWKSTLSWTFKFCRSWGISLKRRKMKRKMMMQMKRKVVMMRMRWMRLIRMGHQMVQSCSGP